MSKKPTLGFLGTGTMGNPIAYNLLRGGFPLIVWNRTPARYANLVAAGATALHSPRAVAAESDVVITMLMQWAHLEALLDGPEGIIAGLRPGSLFIDLATDPPLAARRLSQRLHEHGIEALDAPVRGGEKGAIERSLLIMVGGRREAYERALPIFEAIGKRSVYIGPPGCGQLTKACHQMMMAVTLEAMAETFALSETFGADPARVREALLEGQAASRILELHGARMLQHDWRPGRAIKHYLKDRANLYETAAATGVDLPLARIVFEKILELVQNGRGELDETSLYLTATRKTEALS